ncbi:hypothetical protein PCORN_14834 [Listeria cornellensis FSL F6-0969]|uniref:N-acetyltransferase domain-containing protein n=1 Tax=Listeria cornellensis FSL F6-0969 TaxID=1265820 RepID=W7BNL1_9LIST|nr:hypothetical protein PCORN_14834 [Listeria cornellensis FSL F6-0969]
MTQNMLIAKNEDGIILGSLVYRSPGLAPSRPKQYLSCKIALRVMATNTNALHFYQHLGFEQLAYYLD